MHEALEKLDDIKEKIPDGSYIEICNLLKKANDEKESRYRNDSPEPQIRHIPPALPRGERIALGRRRQGARKRMTKKYRRRIQNRGPLGGTFGELARALLGHF